LSAYRRLGFEVAGFYDLDPARAAALARTWPGARVDQGRGDGADQGGRARLRHPGHSLQLHLPGHDRHALAPGADPGAWRQRARDVHRRQPLGRLGTADEVAAVAVHFASDESGFTTGTGYIIDGGFML
jgi:hypothetical protein